MKLKGNHREGFTTYNIVRENCDYLFNYFFNTEFVVRKLKTTMSYNWVTMKVNRKQRSLVKVILNDAVATIQKS